MKSNTYDVLPISISRLKESLKEQANYSSTEIKKGKNSVGDKKSELLQQQVDALCTDVFSKFKVMKSDYQKGALTLVRYKDHLQDLKSLLTNQQKKIDNPNLQAGIIALELKKFYL